MNAVHTDHTTGMQLPAAGQGACYAVAPSATLLQLLADADSILHSAAGAFAARELADDAQFAAHHLMSLAQGAASAAHRLHAQGAPALAVPLEVYSFAACYQVAAGATVGQLTQDAHALALSARGVLARLEPTKCHDSAALHLLSQAAAALSAAHQINEQATRAAQRMQEAHPTSEQTANSPQAPEDVKTVTPSPGVAEARAEAAQDLAATMEEIDAMVQQHDNAVQSLTRAAINALSPDPDSLVHVRQLLLQVRYSSDELMNTINSKAEDAGRFYVDKDERAFSDRVIAQARHLGLATRQS